MLCATPTGERRFNLCQTRRREREREMNKKNLYVGNLSFKITDEDLMANFSQAGEVVSAAVIRDKFTGQSRGFGFVEMKTDEGAQAAIQQFNGGMLDGKAITVNEAKPKKEFGGGNRGGGGGFRRDGRGGGGNRGGRH